MMYQKILIAVDSSEYSMHAAKAGFDLAHQLHAQVALVFVIDVSKTIGNVDAGISPQEALIVIKKEAELTLDQLAAMYTGGKPLQFMPEGHPGEDIIKTAENWNADLIVVGTHGRTGLLSYLFASVAEYIIKHAHIPVMVVPGK